MKYKCVLFDFNGTLFFDTAFHEEAWKEWTLKIRKRPLNHNEFMTQIKGKNNKDIVEYLLQKTADPEELDLVANGKEATYRVTCLKHNSEATLAKGSIEFFESLKELGIPFTIVTSSEKPNVDFFFSFFNLAKWFDYSKVIFDNGTFPGKPAPDMYLRACETMGFDPEECLVFEDSLSGIQAACNAGIGRVIAIDSDQHIAEIKKQNLAYRIIPDFLEINRENILF